MIIYHRAVKNKSQIEMLRYIKFGNKYKDIQGIFTFIPYDVTVRDSEGNYMGKKDDLPVLHLIGTFGSLDSDAIKVKWKYKSSHEIGKSIEQRRR